MASVQKLKALLGRQCVVAGSPSSSSRSPTTSPLFQIRRRKTLRMFLTRAGSARRKSDSPPTSSSSSSAPPPDNPKTATLLLSNKLKDLFVSSPPPPLEDNGTIIMDLEELSSSTVNAPAPAPARARTAPASHRPLTAVFRYRLLRRPWRPMLLSIPEYAAAATETHY
ncbi:hypothetical protein Sjap_024943 [Stephania japonica]|uniref:Uncharacterized protein n=1 Tax=Stephania japonica TaxID=461633 RepID=A0AAP0EE94_9MAGN